MTIKSIKIITFNSFASRNLPKKRKIYFSVAKTNFHLISNLPENAIATKATFSACA